MTVALTTDLGFDYSNRVFGDQDLVDITRRSWSAERMKRCLRSLAGVQGAVLEVGCGAGRCIRTLAHHRPDLACFGCDISQRAIGAARVHADGVRYDCADANRLPYDNGTFSGIMVMDLIEHVPDVRAVLREIRRVAAPGTILHLHVPCEGHWLSVYRPLLACGIDLTRKAVGHLHHFKRNQVRELLQSEGFEILRTANSMYLFSQIHDLIGWWTILRSHSQIAPGAGDSLPHTSDTSPGTGFRLKHLVSRPAWWAVARVLPVLQFLELGALSWQPLGAIGLCISARLRK